jgi:hypothetical protein
MEKFVLDAARQGNGLLIPVPTCYSHAEFV